MKRLNKRWLYSCFVLTVGFTCANGKMIQTESGVTFDTETKLLWQDNNDAKTIKKQWITDENYENEQYFDTSGDTAISYCENLKLGGFNDWKLPDKDTLKALYPKKSGLQNVTSNDYWSSSTGADYSRNAWYIYFGDTNYYAFDVYVDGGSVYTDPKRYGYLVRCVRNSSNFDNLTFSSFMERLKNSNNTQNSIVLNQSIGKDSKLFLVIKGDKKYFGTLESLAYDIFINQKPEYSTNPFQSIQKLTEEFMSPRQPIDISSRIPEEIQKPTLPKEIAKPILPPMPVLVKSEFETKAMFDIRVAKTAEERQSQINKIQEKYRKDVEARNKNIEYLSHKYKSDVKDRNVKLALLQKEYNDDILAIAQEQKMKNENSAKYIDIFNKISFLTVMESVEIKSATYDAETETMYVTVKATNADFEKKASFKVPLNEAKEFKENLDKQKVQMAFDYKDNGFILKNIEIQNPNQIVDSDKKVKVEKLVPEVIEKTRIVKGKKEKYTETIQVKKIVSETVKVPKTYIALLSTTDFKPEIVEVALQDTKVDFKAPQGVKLSFQNDEFKLSLQNPNLVDKYQVQALGYGESDTAKGLKYNDDLTPLISKMATTQPNQKNWLFAVAIENYDEADAVIYANNSAKTMISAMQKRLGISERNTYSLIDEKATGGAIKGQLERLLENVKEGDNIYFYYSGHGIPSGENGEAFILPKDVIADYVTRESEFMARNIYKKLSDSKAGKIVAFVDSCYSGKTDGISNIKGVAAGVFKTKKVEFDSSKMVVFTAGTNGQFSNAYSEKGQRLFSYFVAKGLATRADLDINSLYQEVSVNVKDESFKMGDNKRQVPQIEGNTGMGL